MDIIMADFNPRTHEECDRSFSILIRPSFYFNPRTHEECDQPLGVIAKLGIDFNPRTHEECDLACAS